MGRSNIDQNLQRVAVKVIDFDKVEKKNRKMIENELAIVKLRLNHKNLI